MIIDEAIAHAREVAKRNRILLDFDELVQKSYDAYFDKLKCEKCAEEHEQLAEWLEELKDYQDKNKMVVHVECKNMDSIKNKIDELSKYAENQYNKAIDDCLLVINENRAKFIADICYSDLYDSIVRLKEHRENGS